MKKLLRPLRKSAAFVALTSAISAFAAVVPTEWRHRQEINVPTSGVVRVELPDATFDAAAPDLRDIRLLDPEGREVPLLLDQPPARTATTVKPSKFETHLEGSDTVVTLTTGSHQPIASLRLETPHPHFLRAARVEISADGTAWQPLLEGLPLFRQWGAEKLDIALGNLATAWVRVRVTGGLPFTGASLALTAGPAIEPLPVGARISARDEFAGETVLTVTLDGQHVPLAALELETAEPLFMRRITVGVRDLRDLVADERIIGTGTLYRVALDGAPARAQLRLEFDHTPLSRELLVHIHNGDSPPLTVNDVRMLRRPVGLIFQAANAGRYTLLSGNPQATAPRYDLAAFAGDLRTARATTVTPGPLEDTPGYAPRSSLAEPPLPDVPLVGAPLDTKGWTRRKAVQLAAPGVQELELDPAALAGARTDFADLRLLRAGHQIPYILERTALGRSLLLSPEPAPDPKRPAVSIWKLDLPHSAVPLRRLVLASDTPLFQRHFRLYEKVVAHDGRTYERTLASGPWNRTPEPGSPRTRVFDLSDRPQTGTIWLETDNGDNPPIALANVTAEHPVVRLVFKTAETDGYELLYGHPQVGAPRYDLSLVARQLLTAARTPVRLGTEESDPEGFARGVLRHLKGGVVFWGALSVVVIVLLVVVARMLPKADTPK